MNFRVIPAWLLPLNRSCNCILLCLKEGGVWEISDNSALPSLLLFICSGRDQFWAAVYSCIRARRIKNHPEPEKCASCASLSSVPWYLILAHFTDTHVFPPWRCFRQLQGPHSPLAAAMGWWHLPKSCPMLQMWKIKDVWWWRGSTDPLGTPASISVCAVPHPHAQLGIFLQTGTCRGHWCLMQLQSGN